VSSFSSFSFNSSVITVFNWFDSQSTRIVHGKHAICFQRRGQLTPGQLAFLCEMMKRATAELAEYVPEVLENVASRHAIYHLQIAAVDMGGKVGDHVGRGKHLAKNRRDFSNHI